MPRTKARGIFYQREGVLKFEFINLRITSS